MMGDSYRDAHGLTHGRDECKQKKNATQFSKSTQADTRLDLLPTK